jgi:glycosyltransferase involved in cell wall biosynthesis
MQLRVIQISTSAKGGGGIAASRLNTALISRGINSSLYVRSDLEISFNRKLLSKMNTFLQRSVSKGDFGIMTPSSISTVNLHRVQSESPDVIHIHNWYNFLSLNDIAELYKIAPLVFTLHDERIYTGGCHNAYGCDRYISGCTKCPGIYGARFLITKSKREIKNLFEEMKEVRLISPSRWLHGNLVKSNLISDASTIYLPNLISIPSVSEDHVGKESVFRILMVAAQLEAALKGASLLLECIRGIDFNRVPKEKTLEFVFMGSGNLELAEIPRGITVKIIGPQTTPEVLRIMQTCDLLVVPSSMENSPNVIGEAQLIGLPVAASNVGGIPELINDNVSGFLFERKREKMLEKLYEIINLPEERMEAISESARREAVNRYNEEAIINRMKEVYETLAKSRKS